MKASASQITGLTKELSNHWQETKAHWKDAKSLEFERMYMEELLAAAEHSITIMAQLDQLITKIRSDCE